MAEGTRFFQLSESVKECQEAILKTQNTTTTFQQQQATHNTAFQQQQLAFQQELASISEMLRTLVAAPPRPPPDRLFLPDPPPHHIPVIPRTFANMVSRLTLTTAWIARNAGLLTTLVGINRMTTVPVLTIFTKSITKAIAFSTPDPYGLIFRGLMGTIQLGGHIR
jgi:hypothetical protein